jgi:uncharacterized membrane protein YfcA
MDWISLLLLICLAGIAFCYAAVGHGGASGYIAVFALFGLVSPNMKSFVLIMNLLVASISFYQYYKQGHFNLKYFLPFGLGAAPMAYFGASLKIDNTLYQYILAAFLFFSVLYLFGFFKSFQDKFTIAYSFSIAFVIALVLGFISGVTGVGGGIFLSPILLILGWLNLKQTAAISSLFIVVNSLASLFAISSSELIVNMAMMYKLILVIVFGYLGSLWGVKIKNHNIIRRLLAFVLLIAALKLCFM